MQFKLRKLTQWLLDIGMIDKLVSFLDPTLPPEVFLVNQSHAIGSQVLIDMIAITYQMPMSLDPNAPPPVAGTSTCNTRLVHEMKTGKVLQRLLGFILDREKPNSASSLINGSSVVMELIRKYCNEIEIAETQYHDFSVAAQARGFNDPYPSIGKIWTLSKDMNDLFIEFSERLPEFAQVLDKPSTKLFPFEYEMAEPENFGSERLKVCELFAEFIHLQYLLSSSPLFEIMVDPKQVEGFMIADGLMLVSTKMVQHGILSRCIVKSAKVEVLFYVSVE